MFVVFAFTSITCKCLLLLNVCQIFLWLNALKMLCDRCKKGQSFVMRARGGGYNSVSFWSWSELPQCPNFDYFCCRFFSNALARKVLLVILAQVTPSGGLISSLAPQHLWSGVSQTFCTPRTSGEFGKICEPKHIPCVNISLAGNALWNKCPKKGFEFLPQLLVTRVSLFLNEGRNIWVYGWRVIHFECYTWTTKMKQNYSPMLWILSFKIVTVVGQISINFGIALWIIHFFEIGHGIHFEKLHSGRFLLHLLSGRLFSSQMLFGRQTRSLFFRQKHRC